MKLALRLALCVLAAGAPSVRAAEAPALRVDFAAPARVVFAAPADGCDPNDVPDAPVRAFRDAGGGITMFGLHYDNRALKGAGLDAVKIDCRVVYPSRGDPDPAAYDDRSWIAATWTDDGRTVDALVHHEYRGNEHPGRCRFADYMACWFNTVLAVRSRDGGAAFDRPAIVVASAPFRQDVDQGRHRGFFNPSNIVADGRYRYFFASTTGWPGQDAGVCLFRSPNPDDPSAWRAFDGTNWSVAYGDPYRSSAHPRPCATVAPFPAPVGAVVRHAPSGLWLAVFQAKADGAAFPLSGFYVATARDLLHWSAPRLLLAGATLYDGACRSGGLLLAYPSLLDAASPSRNFDTAGNAPDLYYDTLSAEGCAVTGRRTLLRRRLVIEAAPR